MMNSSSLPRILTIAGSDSSGGAGILADSKAILASGAYPMTAITAVTAQNTLCVSAIEAMSPDIIRAQIRACAEDIGIDAIKTGMLFSAEIITAVSQELAANSDIPIVVDPVMIATSGSLLLQEAAIEALKYKLFPLARVITPNIPEALTLLKVKGGSHFPSPDLLSDDKVVLDESALRVILEGLQALAPNAAILLKGGHGEGGECVDCLLDEGEVHLFKNSRIQTIHTHGTGCTLASYIAAELGKGKSLYESVSLANAYVHQAIKHAPGLGKGAGSLAFIPA